MPRRPEEARQAPPELSQAEAAEAQARAESAARAEAQARRRRRKREAQARAEAVARSHPAPQPGADSAEAGGDASPAAEVRIIRPETPPKRRATPRAETPEQAPEPAPDHAPAPGRGALDAPEALPAGVPDRQVLSRDQRQRLRAQRKKEKRRAKRSAVGKADAAEAALRGDPAPQDGPAAPPPPAPRIPAPAARAPAPEQDDAATVFAEIQAAQAVRVAELQRDIARRRRRRGAMLFLRLLLFVILPTALSGWWWFKVATPLFVSDSAFVVRTAAEPPSAEGGLAAALGGGSPLAAIQDSISVQDFILSREALDRLDGELGLIARWRDPGLDPLLRLPEGAGAEEALAHHRRLVTVGYDPAESLIRMSVSAPDAEQARAVSAALIGYAEEMVDGLSARMRADMVGDAEARAAEARAALAEAHAAEAALRERLRVFSAETEAGGERAVITSLETEIEKLRARLAEIRSYAPEGDPRIAELERAVAARQAAIETRRARIAGGPGGAAPGWASSLAEAQSALARARAETMAHEQMFLSAQTALEAARLEARRQISYLAVIVPPARADAPTRPRRLANTALAALVCFAVYLFASLTVSVLREQFSA